MYRSPVSLHLGSSSNLVSATWNIPASARHHDSLCPLIDESKLDQQPCNPAILNLPAELRLKHVDIAVVSEAPLHHLPVDLHDSLLHSVKLVQHARTNHADDLVDRFARLGLADEEQHQVLHVGAVIPRNVVQRRRGVLSRLEELARQGDDELAKRDQVFLLPVSPYVRSLD